MPFLLPCPPEAFVEYCRLVDAFLKYLNDNLALAIRCEAALGVLAGIDLAEEEFGKRCDACACDHICDEIEQAAAWLRDHEQDIIGRLFEEVEPMYIRGHPGHFQPFMMAWCVKNGGI